MSKLTTDVKDEIREEVEDVILTSRWRESVIREVGERFGISSRQVYRYRKQVEEMWAKEAAERNIDTERVDVIKRLRNLQALALKERNHRAVERYIAREISILGLEHPRVIEARLTGSDGGPIQIQAVVGQIVAGLADQLKAMPTELVLGTFGSNGNGNGHGAGGNGHGGTIDAQTAAILLEADTQEDPGDRHGDPQQRTGSARRSRKG